jgi:predicted RNA-binding Zn ribbon-like protein
VHHGPARGVTWAVPGAPAPPGTEPPGGNAALAGHPCSAPAATGPAELDAVAAEAVQLREWLRPVTAAWAMAGSPALPEDARDHLNEILALGHRFLRIEAGGDGKPRLQERHSWDDARQLLVPPAEAAAELLADEDRDLVRHCEGPTCTLWFYDRTKSHRRRWCSMSACGNREKARKHRERDRTGTG